MGSPSEPSFLNAAPPRPPSASLSRQSSLGELAPPPPSDFVDFPRGSEEQARADSPNPSEDAESVYSMTPETPVASAEAESLAFAPFKSLDLLSARPAHLATFLHYLLSDGTVEDEMMLFLATRWFCQNPNPSKTEALVLFEDFFTTNAPMRVDSILPEIFVEMETVLNSKEAAPQRLRRVFDRAHQCVVASIATALEHFESMVTMGGLGSLYGAGLLVDLKPDEEQMVVEEMIKPHLQLAVMEMSSEDMPVEGRKRARIIRANLTQLLVNAGVDVERISEVAPGGKGSRRSGSLRGSRKKNFHLHAGHRFATASYSTPTYCGVCKNLLWGLAKQGWTCVDCGFHVHKANDRTGHKKCHHVIEGSCPGFKMKTKGRIAKALSTRTNEKRSLRSKADSFSKMGPIARAGSVQSLNSIGSTGGQASLEVPPQPRSSSGTLPASTHLMPEAPQTPQGRRRGRSFTRELPRQVDEDLGTEWTPVDLPEDPATQPMLWTGTVQDRKTLDRMNKKAVKRQELIYELIQTERGYIRHLMVLQQVFRQPLIEAQFFMPEQLFCLFANLDEVLGSNEPLYEALVQIQTDYKGYAVPELGAVFLAAFGKIDPQAYARFCANQKKARLFYNANMKSHAGFNAYMHRCEAHPASTRLAYPDFIAKPLQRLTKYPLLLEGIAGLTADHSEKVKLDAAVVKAKSVLAYVQDAVKEAEDRLRLQEIDALLDKSILAEKESIMVHDLPLSGHHLLAEGTFHLLAQDRPHEVQLILMTNLLLICEESRGRYLLRIPGRENKKKSAVMTLGSVMVRPVATDDKGFFLIFSGRLANSEDLSPLMYEMQASSRSDRKLWMETITNARDDFLRKYPTYEEELAARLMHAGVLEPEGPDLKARIEESDLPLEVRLGKMVEEMRDNCDANVKMLASVTELLESSGFPCSVPARVNLSQLQSTFGQRSGRFNRRGRRALSRASSVESVGSTSSLDYAAAGALGSQSASFLESAGGSANASSTGSLASDQEARESQEWLSFQLSRSLEQIATLQAQVAELQVANALHHNTSDTTSLRDHSELGRFDEEQEFEVSSGRSSAVQPSFDVDMQPYGEAVDIEQSLRQALGGEAQHESFI